MLPTWRSDRLPRIFFAAAEQQFTGDSPVSDFLAFQHHKEFAAAGVLADGDVPAHPIKALSQARQVVSQMTEPSSLSDLDGKNDVSA
jgi:hypothetical protein